MKTSEVLLAVAKAVIPYGNNVETTEVINLLVSKLHLNKEQLTTTIVNLADRGYLEVQMVWTVRDGKGNMISHIGLTKRACDFIREYNKLNKHDRDEYYTPEFDKELKEAHEQQPTMLDLLK